MAETNCLAVLMKIRKIEGLEVKDSHYTADGLTCEMTDSHGESYNLTITPKPATAGKKLTLFGMLGTLAKGGTCTTTHKVKCWKKEGR